MSSSPETAGRQRQCRDVSAHQERVDKLLYDRKSAAYVLSMSVRTLDLIAKKVIKVHRIGGKILIPTGELKRFCRGRSS